MPYRPHLVSSTTRPTVRPLVQKVFGDFDPLRLNPYLLFDAQTSMVGTLENPTLDLDPSKPDTLNVITATRAGVATYTDVNGLIASAPANTVRVDYTQGAELTPTKFQRVGYTDFSSGWFVQAGVTSEAGDEYENQPVRRVIYDGVTTGGIYQTVVNTVGGVSYTGSFYARRISGSNQIYMRHGFSASGNQTILPVTTEWQKFSVTILGASGGGNVYFGLIQFSAGNDVYEITQPQFEEGTTASSFVANTTGSPKFITGATYGPRVPMILVEPSSENLTQRSEPLLSEFHTTGTNIPSGIVVEDATPAYGFNRWIDIQTNPSGSGYGDAVRLRLNAPTSVTSGATYTLSVHVRTSDGSPPIATSSNTSGDFALLLGPQLRNTTVVHIKDDLYRVSATHTYTDTSANIYLLKYPEQSSKGIKVTGFQVEEGAVATSYMPTSGSTVTRAADDLSILGSQFTNFFNSGGDGTFYAEFTTRTITEATLYVLAGHSGNQRYFYSDVGSSILAVYDGLGGTIYGNIQETLNRVSISYDSNTKTGSLNGSADSTVTGTGDFQDSTRLSIGQSWTSQSQLNGHIKRLIYWPLHSDSL